MTGTSISRRRFLLCLGALPALPGPRASASLADPASQPSVCGPAVVVEYRGWIVDAEDRACLEARAGTDRGQASDPGALQ